MGVFSATERALDHHERTPCAQRRRGGIRGTARLLGQSIGAALFGLGGRHGAETAIVLAACFAAASALTSFSRMFDFVRAPLSGTGSTQPADRP
jgi:hypothetical protein